jgi:VWFA-related protein
LSERFLAESRRFELILSGAQAVSVTCHGVGASISIAMQIPISRRRLFALLSLFPAARVLIAQQSTPPAPPPTPAPGDSAKQQSPTFTANVNVVNLFATVRDKDSHIVSNLNKEDFVLQEDGRPQIVRYFSRETDLPLTLGLLVDTSRSQRNVIEAERSASYTFFEHVLREGKDQAFVLHFDHQVELLQDLTQSRQKLNKALHELEVNQDDSQQGGGGNGGGGYPGGGGGRGGGGGGRRSGGTLLYDAVYLASGDDLMKKQKGRKAVFVLSDGVDRNSKVSITEAIEAAQRSDTLVYSIYFSSNEGFQGFGRGMGRGGGRYPQEERPDGKKILRRISKETGGTFFEVSKKQTIDTIYSRIEEDLRNQYSLGYTSDQQASQTGYRTISLTVDKKNLTVQTREGYYPMPPPADAK